MNACTMCRDCSGYVVESPSKNTCVRTVENSCGQGDYLCVFVCCSLWYARAATNHFIKKTS